MEVFIHENKSFPLGLRVPNYNFELPGGISIVSNSQGTFIPSKQVTQELLEKLNSTGFTPKVKVGQSIPGLPVRVGLQQSTGSRHVFGIIELIGGDRFLRSLCGGDERLKEDVKVQVEVTRIVSGAGGHVIIPDYRCCCYTSLDLAAKDLLAANRRMLTDEVLADTKVIARNGAEIKFHRSILAAHSPAFERMFHTEMQEAISGVLQLPDMTEESVRALKEYLYVWGLGSPLKNSLVCFELFEAAHKYGISTLEEATSKILLKMDEAWYSAEVGLRLFLLVKDMELPRLKGKAVRILRLKSAELKTLDEYRDLFTKENAAVAMQLTECLASYKTF